jgi:hypothetical protein
MIICVFPVALPDQVAEVIQRRLRKGFPDLEPSVIPRGCSPSDPGFVTVDEENIREYTRAAVADLAHKVRVELRGRYALRVVANPPISVFFEAKTLSYHQTVSAARSALGRRGKVQRLYLRIVDELVDEVPV